VSRVGDPTRWAVRVSSGAAVWDSSTPALLAAAREADVDPEIVAARRDAAYLRCAHEVGEVEAVTSVLRRHNSRRKIGLATGGARRTVTVTAVASGLFDLFDVVLTRGDVERGKPAPDLFRLAAQRLGVAAGQWVGSDQGPGSPSTPFRPKAMSVVSSAATWAAGG
jgi:beta-phosphoglucomutase-like phosphatase (HAD superfamily)